jgi:D-xylose transport system permease protein
MRSSRAAGQLRKWLPVPAVPASSFGPEPTFPSLSASTSLSFAPLFRYWHTWQGWWVTRMGVSSFIVTLAGTLYFRGISMITTNDKTVAPVPASLTNFATGFLPPLPAILAGFALFAVFQWATARRARQLKVIDQVGPMVLRALLPPTVFAAAVWLASWQGIPYLVLLVAGSAIAAEILMRRTRFGMQLYAIGGNPEAARLSGIDVNRAIFVNFMIAGLTYGIPGIALTARVSGTIAGSAGLFLELDAIAAAIIGGTALNGGKGRVFGAIVGALLMGSLNNGMSLMNVPRRLRAESCCCWRLQPISIAAGAALLSVRTARERLRVIC